MLLSRFLLSMEAVCPSETLVLILHGGITRKTSLRNLRITVFLYKGMIWLKFCDFTQRFLSNDGTELKVIQVLGRATPQAIIRRLPTAAARVRSQVKSRKICGGQSGTGAGFLRALLFPLQILIPSTAPRLSPHSSGAGRINQIVADVTSEHILTPPQEINKKQSFSLLMFNNVTLSH
jgi:hypothetical protein